MNTPGSGEMPTDQLAAPKQVIYRGGNFSVQPGAPGERVIVFTSPVGEQLLFPITVEVSNTLGGMLMAPGVHMPNGNGPG